MSGPPVFDFSDDPDGFDRHLQAELAKPCQHCEQVAPTYERQGLNLFGLRNPPTELICAACGMRRAAHYPTR